MNRQRTYAVATFYHPETAKDPFAKRTVSAYLRDYSTTWPGCMVFQVAAASGREAKRIAVERRLYFQRRCAVLDRAKESG